MSRSQNGWPGIESGADARLVRIPKIIGRVLGGDVAVIFTDLVEQFDAHVENVDLGADDWGHAFRAVRAGSSLSNHASGTAIDLNAMRHPLGKVGTFTAGQVAALRQILARYGGVVRWGGDYSGRKDEMHFEIVGTPAQVADVAARLRAGFTGSGASVAAPTIGPTLAPVVVPDVQEDDMTPFRIHVGSAPADQQAEVGKVYLCAFGPTGTCMFQHVRPSQNQALDRAGVPLRKILDGGKLRDFSLQEKNEMRRSIVELEAKWKVAP